MKTTLRIGLALLLLSTALLATPNMLVDAQTLSPDDPGLGRIILAAPNTLWQAWFNDNYPTYPGGDDYDFNDAVVEVQFDAEMKGWMRWIGSISGMYDHVAYGAAWVNADTVGPVEIGWFDPGDEVRLNLITEAGYGYYAGPAWVNGDGKIHAWVTQVSEAPEPSTFALLAAGAGLFCLRKRN